MGHIPGPWDVVESPSLLHVETSIDNSSGAGIHVCSLTKAKAADARLIAAAPEMLAKLKEIHSRMACSCRLQPFVGGPVPCETCQIANVIAKAEGK